MHPVTELTQWEPADSGKPTPAVADGLTQPPAAGGGSREDPSPQRTEPAALTAGEKILVVLEAAVAAPRFSAIVARTGLPKATVHRILATLLERSFVVVTDAGEYLPGPRFLGLTGRAFERIDVGALLSPIAERLAHEVGCIVHAGVRSGDEMVYLVRAEIDKPYQVPSRVGGTVRMHTSGMGKSVLSRLPEKDVLDLAARTGLERRTARSITNVPELLAELAEVRRVGYCFDREENVPGVVCIATAFPDYTGHANYGISISTLALEYNLAQLRAFAPLLLQAAAEMATALGYVGPLDGSPARSGGALPHSPLPG